MATAPLPSECLPHNPCSSSSFALLSGEIIADVLEYLSSKRVILFSTLRGISRLFHQAVALNFERHYFQKPKPQPSRASARLAFEVITQLAFSAFNQRALRTFLTMLPWISESCLQSVETLWVPFSLSQDTFRTLARWLPNVKSLALGGGDARHFTTQTAEVLTTAFPFVDTLSIEGAIDKEARDMLVSSILAITNCRLRLLEDPGATFGTFYPNPLDSLKPYAELFCNLTWLHLQELPPGEWAFFPFCANLEVLVLSNVTLKESFFRDWKRCEGGYQRKSLRSLELSYITFSHAVPNEAAPSESESSVLGDCDPPPVWPPPEDVDEFFSLNAGLTFLDIELSEEDLPWFPWDTCVAKYCPQLQSLHFSDNGLQLAELETLVTSLTLLKSVSVQVRTDELLSERLALIARFDNLQSLELVATSGAVPILPRLTQLYTRSRRAQPSDLIGCVLSAHQLKRVTLPGWSQPLLDSIAEHCPLLEHLQTGIGENLESVASLALVLQRCRQLRGLTVSTFWLDPKLLDDIVAQRAQLSSLTIESTVVASNAVALSIENFIQNLPSTFSSLRINVDGELAEMVLRELSKPQYAYLDLRILRLGSNMDVKICVQRWKTKLSAMFPNLVLL